MGKRTRTGICHICGVDGALTFEHVPPRSAFNNRPVVLTTFEEALEFDFGQQFGGKRIQQRGAGDYTLCAKCNNDTGAWYGKNFVEWSYQGMDILFQSKGTPTLIHLHYLFPLSILKQVVTMFFSINRAGFSAKHPELVRFVLNKRTRHLPSKYRFFTYFTASKKLRSQSFSVRGNFTTRKTTMFSELAFPPFGYVMTIDSEPPDNRLTEITHFARYNYNEFDVIGLRIPKLPISTPLPGDYRTQAEVDKAMQDSVDSH